MQLVCLTNDFGLVKLQMGIMYGQDLDQLRQFSLASFVLYED